MENSRRQDQQIIFLQADAYPFVLQAPHVEKSIPVQDIADLFVLVQVLVEEHADFLLIDVAHLLRRHRDFVPVLVDPFCSDLIDVGNGRAMVVEDAEVVKLFDGEGAPGIVVFALVNLGEVRPENVGLLNRL